jgi:hypothetical protein
MEHSVNKIIRENQVAIVLSTEGSISLTYDIRWKPELVELVLSDEYQEACGEHNREKYSTMTEQILGSDYQTDQLTVKWVDIGRPFVIFGNDYGEYIRYQDRMDWVVA